MKIALVNHGTAGEWGGGDSVQIRETAKRLIQRGHEVSIQNSDTPNVNEVDIVHIFNSRVFSSLTRQISTCQIAGVPIVVSPIWISIGRAIWGSRGTFAVLSKGVSIGEESIKQEMELMRSRELIVNIDGDTIDANGKGTYNLSWQSKVGKLLNSIDGLIPNSWLELKSVQTDLNWRGDNYEIAHYGVDPKLFLDADPELFRTHTGIKGDFVLQAGRIEPGKNQAMLCWALRKTNIPIILIGGSNHWPAYAELCKEISGDRLKIINHLPQDILASAYAAARVHSLVSWMDTCGLVSLEAGLNGIPLVGSTFGHELEYLQRDAWLADPADEESILKAIEKAWFAGKKSDRPRKLKERIMAEYNWERATTATEKLYSVLSKAFNTVKLFSKNVS